MKNMKIAFIALLVFGGMRLANGYSNKSYLQPRPEGVNAPVKHAVFDEVVDQTRLLAGLSKASVMVAREVETVHYVPVKKAKRKEPAKNSLANQPPTLFERFKGFYQSVYSYFTGTPGQLEQSGSSKSARRRVVTSHTVYEKEERDIKPFFGGVLQVVPFYQETENSRRTGRYFLVHDKNPVSVHMGDFYNAAGNTGRGVMDDVYYAYLVHKAIVTEGVQQELNAEHITIGLRPRQRCDGVMLSYNHLFDRVAKNFFVWGHACIEHKEHEARFGLSTKGEEPLYYEKLQNFFNGNLEIPAVDTNPLLRTQSSGQVKLIHAKYTGKLTTGGVADIDCGLGYVLFNKKAYQLSLALGLTIPTGNTPRGEFVFEPIYGNGGHVGFGGNLDGWARLYEQGKTRIVAQMKNEVRYLFCNSEIRTVGIRGREWGHYYALGKVGQAQLIPAANVLTIKTDVTPGFQYDGMFGLMYENNGWCGELGYNLYIREREKVRLHNVFPDNTYAIAARGHVTAEELPAGSNNWFEKPFVISPATVDGSDHVAGILNTDAIVNASTIDTNVAQTPAQCANGIYGSFGHLFNNEPDSITMLSAGGSYEWAVKNSAMEKWGVWVKLGVGF